MQFFRNRFRARIVLASFTGIQVPAIVAGTYMLLRPQGVDWPLLSVLAVATVASAVATSVRVRRELEPVIGIARSLRDFARHQVWRPAAYRPFDEIGQLGRATENVVETICSLWQEREENARKDYLTGLPTRLAFMDMIGEQPPASLALIDIDRLKSINDLYGHDAGNEALRCFADVIAAELGPRDILARWRGEEFALYLDEADPDRAHETLETMRQAVASSTGIAPHRVTFSAGLVAMSGDLDLDSAAAEELLHAAKKAGRNQVMTPMIAIAGGAADLRDLALPREPDMLLSGT